MPYGQDQFGNVVHYPDQFGAGGFLLKRLLGGGGGRPRLLQRNQPQPRMVHPQPAPMVAPYGAPQPQVYGQELIIPAGYGAHHHEMDEFGAAQAYGEDLWEDEGEDDEYGLEEEEFLAENDPDEFNGLNRLSRVFNRRQGKAQKWEGRQASARTGLGRKIAGRKASKFNRRAQNTKGKMDRKSAKLGVAGGAIVAGGAGGEFHGTVNTFAPAGPGRLMLLPMYPVAAATGWAITSDSPMATATIPGGATETGDLQFQSPNLPNMRYKVVAIKTSITKGGAITGLVKNLETDGAGSLLPGKKWHNADAFDVDKVEATAGLRAFPEITSPGTVELTARAQGAEAATLLFGVSLVVDVLEDNAPSSTGRSVSRFAGPYAA